MSPSSGTDISSSLGIFVSSSEVFLSFPSGSVEPFSVESIVLSSSEPPIFSILPGSSDVLASSFVST